ncbi:MAG TPA: hypothetical protein VG893_15215 [Terracidiphilus sp.]|nr:hypothetical protein [Terracidiphilus sp.]
MKRFLAYALVLGSLSIPAFAAKNSQSLTLSTPVTVGSTQLDAGNYKITWTGTGANVEVTIAQKGKTPVTVAAKMVDAKNGRVGIITDTINGKTVLQTIQLDKADLVLAGASSHGE